MSKKSLVNLVCFVLLVVWMTGCTTAPPAGPKRRLFFPMPPATPKLEFIDLYSNQHSFPKTRGQIFKEQIFGPEPAIGPKRPFDVASNGKGKFYVSDIGDRNVYVFDLNKQKVKPFARAGTFKSVLGVALDKEENLYVADVKEGVVLVFDKNGNPKMTLGEDSDLLNWPVAVAVDDKLGRVYVANSHGNNITVFDKKGKHLFSFGKRGSARESGVMNFPSDVEVASDGRIVVADSMNAKIRIFDSSGKELNSFGRRGDGHGEFELMKGIGIDSYDHIYISDSTAVSVEIFSLDGDYLLTIGGPYKAKRGKIPPGGFTMPSGIDVDDVNGIFVADQLGRFVQIFQYLDKEYLKENPIEK